MIFISHRGNICGPDPKSENKPDQIQKVINMGFDVEIDVWHDDNCWYLGHDTPETKVDELFLKNTSLWCHAKNLSALEKMLELNIHCFWHQEDDFTLTSKGFIWTYPDKKLTKNSIAVLKNLSHNKTKIPECAGICSDWVYDIRDNLKND
jgi:hypothetical protein